MRTKHEDAQIRAKNMRRRGAPRAVTAQTLYVNYGLSYNSIKPKPKKRGILARLLGR